MNKILEKYLYRVPEAYYEYNGKQYMQSVHGKSYIRYNKAKEQAGYATVDVDMIIKHIKEFLNEIGISTIENPIYSPQKLDYSRIKAEFDLEDERDLVWIKFTKDGYVGVVATSNDVNFDIPQSSHEYDKKHIVYNPYSKEYEETWLHNSSGILVHKLGKEWNTDFVLIFPLKNIPKGYKRADIEEAVGNLLIEKRVPILDYYSHLY